MSKKQVITIISVVAVVLILLGGNALYAYLSDDSKPSETTNTTSQNTQDNDASVGEYVKNGMTKDEVREILGQDSEECEKNEDELAGTETCTYIANDNILGLSGRAFGVIYEADGTVSAVSEVKF